MLVDPTIMKSLSAILLTGTLIVASSLALQAFASGSSRSSLAAAAIERGRNFTHNVGMCVDCHSPRGENGEFIADKHLTGSLVGFAPTVPMPAWAPAAPRIAGLPAGYTEEQVIHFLMTGERPHQLPPVRPPMPLYRLSREDATAVAAYLHSLEQETK
jgi:cytochrome c553